MIPQAVFIRLSTPTRSRSLRGMGELDLTPIAETPRPADRAHRARWCRRSRPPSTSTPPTPSSGMRPASSLQPVPKVNRVEMALLKGVDRVRDILVDNTERFAARPAGQQRAALGRARHGQERRWSRPRMPRSTATARRCPAAGAAEADRDPSRGYRQPAGADGDPARRRPHASSSSATTSPSTTTTPPTSR